VDAVVGGLLVTVVVVAAIVGGVVWMRASGPRPDAPLKGAEHDGREAAQEGSQWKADRPGGPGQEAEDPVAGDAAPGAPGDDESGRDG